MFLRFKMVLNGYILKNFNKITYKTPSLPFLENFDNFENLPPPQFTFHCIFKKGIVAECDVLWVKKANYELLEPYHKGRSQGADIGRGPTPPTPIGWGRRPLVVGEGANPKNFSVTFGAAKIALYILSEILRGTPAQGGPLLKKFGIFGT